MAKKMLMLEAELKQIKSIQDEGETTIETNSIVKDPEIIKDAQQDQVTTERVKKLKAVKRKDDRIKTKDGKDSYKCEVCDYTCKKFETLNKHRNTKHTGHACKVCGKNLINSMELLQHVAIEHNEEDEILNNFISMENGKADTHGDRRNKDIENEHLEKEKEFVFSESMLDEFLP